MAVLGALGDLVLALSADTARFQSDLGRAQRMADKFGKEVGRALGNVAGILVALGGSAGFGTLIKSQIDAADEAGKMAQKIGIAVEQLSAYQVAAALSDVSNEQLQIGFQQLAKNQADFIAGTGEAKDAFAALGITVDQVKKRNGDTAALFELVAGKLAEFEDGANKTAIAMKIFGRSGAELIPMINSLEETRKEAELFGRVVDRDTAAAAERFNDNLTRIGIAVQAVGLHIARGALPMLEQMSEKLVQAAKDSRGLEGAAMLADRGLRVIANAATIVGTTFSLLGRNIGAVAAALWQAAQGNFREAWNIIRESAVDNEKEIRDAIKSLVTTWDDTAKEIKAKAEETGKKLAAPALVSAEATKKAAKEAFDAYKQLFEFEQQVQAEANEATNEYFRKQGELNAKAAEDQKEMWRQVFETIDQEQERAIEEGRILLEQESEAAKKAAAAAKELGLTFESAFERAVLEGQKFSEVLKGIEQDIVRIILRKAITEPIVEGVTNAIGGFDFGKIFNFGGARAEGGPVQAGRAFVVGEEGPELFVPTRPGTVIPHEELGGVSVSVSNVINIDSRTDRAVIFSEVNRALRASERRTIAAMQELNRR